METKWTPGSWSVPHFAEPDAGCSCKYVLTDHLLGAVASVHCSGDDDDVLIHGDNPRFAEAVANAHLIAAAPALYGALTCALGVIVEMGNLNGFHTLTDEQLGRAVIEVAQQCSDALALARGEHPTPESRVGLDPDAGTRQPNQESENGR